MLPRKAFTMTRVSTMASACREFVGSIRNSEVSTLFFVFLIYNGSHLGIMLTQHFLCLSVYSKLSEMPSSSQERNRK